MSIRDCLSYKICFRLIFRINKHVWVIYYHFMMIYQRNHVQNKSRSMMIWKIKILKLWWKYDSYIFIRDCLSYKTCFRLIFRINKLVWMYILSFYEPKLIKYYYYSSMKSYQNESRSMMIYKIKINMLNLWWKYDSYIH